MIDWNALAADIHAENAKWWRDPATHEPIERNKGEMFMLIVSEVAEAMEGERKGLMDDKLRHRRMAEVELADVVIRVADMAAGFDVELDPAVEAHLPPITGNKGDDLLVIVGMVIVARIHVHDGEPLGKPLSAILVATLRYADHHGYDILGAMAEKRAFNRVRVDHTDAARLAAGGKAW